MPDRAASDVDPATWAAALDILHRPDGAPVDLRAFLDAQLASPARDGSPPAVLIIVSRDEDIVTATSEIDAYVQYAMCICVAEELRAEPS